MDDNRTRGWLLARLVLAIAVLTVIAIPLLARSEPMSGLSSWESFGYRFGPVIAEAIAIAGLVWMLRIWRAGGRDSSAAWRYRVEVEPDPIAELRDDTPPDDRPIADTRARGWLVARLELVLAVVVVLVATIILTHERALRPRRLRRRTLGTTAYQVWAAASRTSARRSRSSGWSGWSGSGAARPGTRPRSGATASSDQTAAGSVVSTNAARHAGASNGFAKYSVIRATLPSRTSPTPTYLTGIPSP